MTVSVAPLKRLFKKSIPGSWGSDPGEGDVSARCIRGTDFDYERLIADGASAPLRGFTRTEVANRALRPGDLVIEKSGGGDNQPVGRAVRYVGEELAIPTNFAGALRPADDVDSRFACYLLASLYTDGRTRASIKQSTGIQNLDLPSLLSTPVAQPSAAAQQAIADFLDAETARIDSLIAAKTRMSNVVDERIDALLGVHIAASALTGAAGRATAPLRRMLVKLNRAAVADAGTVTAYRDGQVTLRSDRRAEGYTESWTDGASRQGVEPGDVVVHGLDGFAGAIGTAEKGGACSPVYHVCQPIDGDSDYWGRLLRVLAVTGYLGLFASSTRERAVDFRNWQRFSAVPVPVVDRAEQERLGAMIRWGRPLRVGLETGVGLLRERRQSLITAAVTGEIEV